MKDNQLKQLLNLIRRTGDRCVVADSESEEIFTLMTLSDYEKLLNNESGRDIAKLSEDEMMDKINRDIAYWRSIQPSGEYLPEFEIKKEQKKTAIPVHSVSAANKLAVGKMVALGDVLKNKEYFTENLENLGSKTKIAEIADDASEKIAVQSGRVVESPFGNLGAEESLSDVAEDEAGEEKFYLEPVE